jgi:hypothetical protein
MAMERIVFPPGEGSTVYTSNLCDLLGCEKCSGILTAEFCEEEDLDPPPPIFCTHWCHRKGGEA